MKEHEDIRLYLPDTIGQNYSRYALSLSNKYKDESRLYNLYKENPKSKLWIQASTKNIHSEDLIEFI